MAYFPNYSTGYNQETWPPIPQDEVLLREKNGGLTMCWLIQELFPMDKDECVIFCMWF
jgi:hypothetical protein